MFRNTTPTNELIMETVELYALLLAVLHIPIGLNVTMTSARKPVLTIHHDVCCAGVEHALMFYSEAIAAPLVEAFEAIHKLSECTYDRVLSDLKSNGAAETVNRAEIKRLRAIVAKAEQTVRREIVREFIGDVLG
ncbi:hypothetical protein ACQPYK_25340 [Streptosporangium sp. CA-135522]|uniref:hypothetical protein n=1 Tax=Streptosporangium sp. CA-135522 TaxID=3240072 RepID=UPI003D8D2494